MDELEVLAANQIPYEIVPGVTAALGAAACAGIPLTARGYTTAVRLLTYYKSDAVTDAYWKELAATDDTLVFYMSSETLDGVVANLIKNNIERINYWRLLNRLPPRCRMYMFRISMNTMTS
ncbi:SAM-dependent methyltransferase [Paraflavitalea speifideaquila]|uniref:SAM-dependent methyltransferase n=1 Tax=Paraflavitalea speifideaquila TaxID=3076558 RepID=UPI0028E72A1D|nr:SAM-dependent methyltransferase [Paraflavitalea speifideiaquila]